MKKKEAQFDNVGINGDESRDLIQVGDEEIRKKCALTKKILADICFILGETLGEYDMDSGLPISLIEPQLNKDLADKKTLLRTTTKAFKDLVIAENLKHEKQVKPDDQYKTDMADLTSYIQLARQALIANNKALGIMRKCDSDAESKSTGELETSDKKRVNQLTPMKLKEELEESRKKIVEAHNLIVPSECAISYDALSKMPQADRFSKLRAMRALVEQFNKNSLEEFRKMDHALSGDVHEKSKPKILFFPSDAPKHKVLQITVQKLYSKMEELVKFAEGCGISVGDYKNASGDEAKTKSLRKICDEIKGKDELLRNKFAELINEVRCTKEKVDFDVKFPIFSEVTAEISAREIIKIFDTQYSAVLGLTNALHQQSSKYSMAPVEVVAPISMEGKPLQQKIEDAKEGLRVARLKYEESRKGLFCDMEKLQKLAGQGNLDAKAMLGCNYLYGHNTQKDIEKAKEILSSFATEESNEPAVIWVKGLCHWQDIPGFNKNDKLTEQLLEEAAQKNYAPAQNDLGDSYQGGIGVNKDDKKAVKWYEKAAEQGYAPAQNALGLCYALGKGVNLNPKKAVEWYEKAAEQRYALAQYSLGICFFYGIGVDKDAKKAVEWFTMAAEHGEALAQYNLGLCYALGKGVNLDTKKAVEWYTKAAEQGEAHAQYALKRLEPQRHATEYNTINFGCVVM